jgi:hypothetical protein
MLHGRMVAIIELRRYSNFNSTNQGRKTARYFFNFRRWKIKTGIGFYP